MWKNPFCLPTATAGSVRRVKSNEVRTAIQYLYTQPSYPTQLKSTHNVRPTSTELRTFYALR